MILDRLENAKRYHAVHPGFEAAFKLLIERTDVRSLEPGRHDVDGDRLFLVMVKDQGRGRAAAPLEVHHKYIDIQMTLDGGDEIGWKALSACHQPQAPFDADKDLGFFLDAPDTWVTVAPGCFAVFFPEDAHAPMATTGQAHKAVVKVAVEWK